MNKKNCIIHANCQGEPFIKRLMTSPEFAEQFECRLFTNYIREPIPASELAGCSLFLYQHLGPEWNELSSDALLAQLPDSTPALCIPNMFFKAYWPFWSGAPGFNYRDILLDEMINLGLPAEETIVLFLRMDIANKHDLTARVNAMIEQERQREAHTPIKYLDLILDTYREKRLFNTVNHPGPELLNHATRHILKHLHIAPADETLLADIGDDFPEFEQPIHPKIAAFFNWDFAHDATEYDVYGTQMTYAKYVTNYVVAQKSGVEDFIAFLQEDGATS